MFRREARVAQQQKLVGAIAIHNPISWQVLAYGLTAIMGVLATYLVLGSYTRVETVLGQLKPDMGVAVVAPTRAGVLSAVLVKEGQYVGAGTPLISVKVEEVGLNGTVGLDNVLRALEDQASGLESQERSLETTGGYTRERILARITGLRSEVREIEQQIAMQVQLVAGADSDLQRASEIAERGYLSKRDLQFRQDALFSRRQQLSALRATLADRLAGIADAEQSIQESRDTIQSAASRVASERAAVGQRRVEIEAARGYTIVSPINGIVTGVTARVGQPVQAATNLLMVVPSGARLQAELQVPSSAIGFVQRGQETRLQVAAYPYERFGTVRARVLSVSTAAVVENAAPSNVPHYLVVAEIADPSILAFGNKLVLQPDMAVTARIVTERRSLLEWIFEPLFAVRNR